MFNVLVLGFSTFHSRKCSLEYRFQLSQSHVFPAVQVADYPFTTLVPNLGVCEMDFRTTVFADIPGTSRPTQALHHHA